MAYAEPKFSRAIDLQNHLLSGVRQALRDFQLGLDCTLTVTENFMAMFLMRQYALSFRFVSLIDEVETLKEDSDVLPFRVRVQGAYKLLAEVLPLVYPSFTFTVKLQPSSSHDHNRPGNENPPLTIDNLQKCALISDRLSAIGPVPHSARVMIIGSVPSELASA